MSIATSLDHRAMQLTGRDYISHSALATYRQCPLKYRFRYIDQLQEQTVAANLLFGAAIHNALELFFTSQMAGDAMPEVDRLIEAFVAYWSSQSTKRVVYRRGEDRAYHVGVARRMLRALRNSSHAKTQGKIVGVEAELRAAILEGCPTLLARLDLLVETDDALIVTDVKTSRGRWNAGQAEKCGDQLRLYGALVQERFPEKPVKLQYLVITKSKSPSIDVHPVQFNSARIEQTKHQARKTWERIDAEYFNPTPSEHNCANCPFEEPCRQQRNVRPAGQERTVRLA